MTTNIVFTIGWGVSGSVRAFHAVKNEQTTAWVDPPNHLEVEGMCIHL